MLSMMTNKRPNNDCDRRYHVIFLVFTILFFFELIINNNKSADLTTFVNRQHNERSQDIVRVSWQLHC